MITQEQIDSLAVPLCRKHRVVCVDDDAAILAALRRLLRREPYELIVTDDPQVALRLIRESEVSLLLADQRMPAMVGTELLQAARELSPGTARVMLTSHALDKTVIVHRKNQTIRRLITKPWYEDGLRQTIRELLMERELEEIALRGEDGRVPTDINVEIQAAILQCPAEAMVGLDILTDFQALPPVPCYMPWIRQVFLNLFMNTIEECHERGRILVSTRRVDGEVVVRIRDIERAIPEERRRSLFDSAVVAGPTGKGAPLGLPMVRRIVEAHGGRIDVASEQGRGTEFTVRLPLGEG